MAHKRHHDVDILIIGGGLVGATLLLALAKSGYRVLLIENKSLTDTIDSGFDVRALALSAASIRILGMIQLWPLLVKEAVSIETIHVSEQKRFGVTRLEGSAQEPLGFVVEMCNIQRELHTLLPLQSVWAPAQLLALDCAQSTATVLYQNEEYRIHANLIVAADGTDSFTRRLCGLKAEVKEYDQTAIAATIGLARPHQNIAYERFSASGPLALLPLSQNRASLVWSLSPSMAQSFMAQPPDLFLHNLQKVFGYRLGRMIKVGQRQSYALRQVTMSPSIAWPVVFVGNAAHTLHPVAGQGFNLGLRDVALLAQCIVEKGINSSMLKHYQTLRQSDQDITQSFTDGLIQLFSTTLPGAKYLRSLGLTMLDILRPGKTILNHYAGGFGGYVSDLVCEIPLNRPH